MESGAEGPEEAGEAEEKADPLAPLDGPGKGQGLTQDPGRPFAAGITGLATVVERDGCGCSGFAVICHNYTLNGAAGAVKDLIHLSAKCRVCHHIWSIMHSWCQ